MLQTPHLFSGTIAEGKVWGRGAADTKGSLCAILFAAEEMLGEGFVPPVLSKAKSVEDKTPVQMLKMPVFYVMLVLLTCGGTFGLMIISGAKGLALDMTPASTSPEPPVAMPGFPVGFM